MNWEPTLGAWPRSDGTHFRVWAPKAKAVELLVEQAGSEAAVPLQKDADGYFQGVFPDIRVGARYRYRVDGQGPFPDPVSRFQPEGVHGHSEVVDSARFAWTDANWRGIALEDVIVYELHVGTFTPEGTFAGAAARLPYLKQLGVTAVELMPVADFPGQRNWGYDGVCLFAPARCYGTPDDLRRFVDAAHALGLAVFLDVVYNHLGPDGNYLGVYSPFYFSEKHHTDWGAALNFDGDQSTHVRQFFIENALHWVNEYHIDGLRLDATHVIMDDGPRHFLAELTERVHSTIPGKTPLVIAEDHRNLATMLQPASAGGWDNDGVWADDFHHQVRRLLAGDNEAYYRDFTGTTADLAATMRQGWFFCGQPSIHLEGPRGTDPVGIPPMRFFHCIQNHDQTGNRALGERIHHDIDHAAYRAATVVLLCSPATPLLFMGQEWAASTPFQFFTDHNEELGKLVTEGRRKEFRHFAAFTDPAARARIPDPQSATTFLNSQLKWDERNQESHAAMERFYQAILKLRRSEPALRANAHEQFAVSAIGDAALLLVRLSDTGPAVIVLVHFKGAGAVDVRSHALLSNLGNKWEVILTTEDAAFCTDASPPKLDFAEKGLVARFTRPGAVILRAASR